MYIILSNRDQIKLGDEVNKYLQKGFQCQGGLTIKKIGNLSYYYQPVIKNDNSQRTNVNELKYA